MKRTKRVAALISKMEDVKIFFEDMVANKQAIYDNMSEKAQESDKGEDLLNTIGDLEDMRDESENLFSKFVDMCPEDEN